jgi:hypothetical protein
MFLKGLLPHNILGAYSNVSSFASTSKFRMSTMLALPIVEIYNVRFWRCLQWHNVHTKVHKTPSIGSRVE